MATALARTEAARTARFVLSTSAAGPLTEASGTVDFRTGELAMTMCCSWSSGKGRVFVDVREIGDVVYTFVPLPPLIAAGWTAQRVSRRLDELQFPLRAFPPRARVTVQRRTSGAGRTAPEYVLHVPGVSRGGERVAPYALLVDLDGQGRIRSAGRSMSETGVPGRKGKLSVYDNITFSDFGLPVQVVAPEHSTWGPPPRARAR